MRVLISDPIGSAGTPRPTSTVATEGPGWESARGGRVRVRPRRARSPKLVRRQTGRTRLRARLRRGEQMVDFYPEVVLQPLV